MPRPVPLLETPRLVLTMPDVEAAPAVARFYADNEAHLAPWSPPRPDNFHQDHYWRRRLRLARDEWNQERGLRLFLARAEQPDSPIGFCNFTQLVRGPFLACTLGYGLGARWEGQGLMREALERALDYMFRDVGLHRVMANYLPTNVRSGGLLRRLGFVVEGYARDYLFIDGAWRDHVLTARTSPYPTVPA